MAGTFTSERIERAVGPGFSVWTAGANNGHYVGAKGAQCAAAYVGTDGSVQSLGDGETAARIGRLLTANAPDTEA